MSSRTLRRRAAPVAVIRIVSRITSSSIGISVSHAERGIAESLLVNDSLVEAVVYFWIKVFTSALALANQSPWKAR